MKCKLPHRLSSDLQIFSCKRTPDFDNSAQLISAITNEQSAQLLLQYKHYQVFIKSVAATALVQEVGSSAPYGHRHRASACSAGSRSDASWE